MRPTIKGTVAKLKVPKNYSSINLKNLEQNTNPLAKHLLTFTAELDQGDCLYIPSYWWQQIDSSPEKSIGVTFWYPTSSDWMKLTFHGIEENLI